jgi:transcriptional regulator with XRE-family HTH domain
MNKRWPAYREELLADPAVKAEYDALAEEYALAHELIAARVKSGLTQEELAARMETTQSTVARWESGKALPSTRTLLRMAAATGTTLHVHFATDGEKARPNKKRTHVPLPRPR